MNPLPRLDAQTRCQMQAYLCKSGKRDVTILFITHDSDEAAYLADRIPVMGANPGRVVEFIENPVPMPAQRRTIHLAGISRAQKRLEEHIHPPVEVPENAIAHDQTHGGR